MRKLRPEQYVACGGNRHVQWQRVGAIVTIHVRIAKATPLNLTLPTVVKKLQS